MKKTFILSFILFFVSILNCNTILAEEFDGWIKSETCWVVKKPDRESTIVGIISKKAAVTVEAGTSEFAKIIYAPVRDPLTMKFFDDAAGLYIQRNDISKDRPDKW